MTTPDSIIAALQNGEVIAYPTEGVWGFGCDPFSESAVKKVCELKNRSLTKGFIVLIRDWEMLESLVANEASIQWHAVKATWPGAVSWVFPPAETIPDFLQSANGGIALRMPAHPPLRQLLTDWGKPLLSTSANVSGHAPCMSEHSVQARFPGVLSLPGELGSLKTPTPLYDACSGKQLR